MELLVASVDHLAVCGPQLGTGHLAALEQALRLLGGEPERVDHADDSSAAPVGGTRK